jgi:WD40 repeat protein
LKTGISKAHLQVPGGINVTTVKFKEDQIAVGCQDGIVRIWDIGQNRWIKEFQGHSLEVGAIHFGDKLVSGSEDQTIRVNTSKSNTRFGI